MLLKDLEASWVAGITIIFTQFADLYNLNKSYGFSRYIKSMNEKCYIEVHFIHQRRHPDGCLHGMPGRQDRRSRFPSPQGKTLGALGEELEAPTKAGAAPPRRGLPDEGGSGPGTPLVRREPPLEG